MTFFVPFYIHIVFEFFLSVLPVSLTFKWKGFLNTVKQQIFLLEVCIFSKKIDTIQRTTTVEPQYNTNVGRHEMPLCCMHCCTAILKVCIPWVVRKIVLYGIALYQGLTVFIIRQHNFTVSI